MFFIGGDTPLPQEPGENLHVKFEIARDAEAQEASVRDVG